MQKYNWDLTSIQIESILNNHYKVLSYKFRLPFVRYVPYFQKLSDIVHSLFFFCTSVASNSGHIFLIGRSTVVVWFLQLFVLVHLVQCELLRLWHATISPTFAFLDVSCHLCPRWSPIKYTLLHLSQNYRLSCCA